MGTLDGKVAIVTGSGGGVGRGIALALAAEGASLVWRSGPLASFRLMGACHRCLRNGGVIVNLATSASFRPDPIGYGCYAAVKEAIRALTRAATVEWGSDGIRVHAIVPLSNIPAFEGWCSDRPEEFEAFRATVPLGRIGDQEADIGLTVVFLCGPDSAYITGGTLLVDGGQAFLR